MNETVNASVLVDPTTRIKQIKEEIAAIFSKVPGTPDISGVPVNEEPVAGVNNRSDVYPAPIVEIISDELAVVRTENANGAQVTGIVIQPPEIQTFNEDGSLAGVKTVSRTKEETVAARDRAIEDAIAASKVPAKGSSALAAAFARSNEKRATQPQHANASANAKVTKRKTQ